LAHAFPANLLFGIIRRMMNMPCVDESVGNNPSGHRAIAHGTELIGLPPGLSLHQRDLCESVIGCASLQLLQQDQGENANVDCSESFSDDVQDIADMFTDESLAMHILQRARWNLTCARAAHETAQLHQAYLHLQRHHCAPGIMFQSVPPGSFVRCSDVPMRPPGVWHKPAVRTSSRSSNASTRASNEEPLGNDVKDETEGEPRYSQQMQIEIPRGNSFCRGGVRIVWPVDARKLRSGDMQIVSPAFELFPSTEFKLLIKAAAKGGKRGQAGFKAARGRGDIELKCVARACADVPPLTFRISVKVPDGKPKAHSVVTHDFSYKAIYGTSQSSQPWEFDSAVDSMSKMFVVCLEVAAQPSLSLRS